MRSSQKQFPRVNTMSYEEIRNLLFPRLDIESIPHETQGKYKRFSELLINFPIKTKKICIISPPQMSPDHVIKRMTDVKGYMTYLPRGAMTLAKAVHLFNSKWQVEIVDLNLEVIKRSKEERPHDFDTLLKSIPDNCDLYGVTYMFASVELYAIKIFEYLKLKGKFVMAGGVQATADSVELLKYRYADIVIKGDGEVQLNRLLYFWENSLSGKETLSQESAGLANLSFQEKEQVISFDYKHENIIPLDIRDEYENINMDDYHTYGTPGIWCRTAGEGKKYATIPSVKGCRGKCIFCAVSSYLGQGARPRDPDDVIDEILYLYNKKGVRHIEWTDDDMLADRSRVLRFLNKLRDQKLELTWSTSAFVLAISVDEEVAKAMSDSGCVMTGFGVESGDEERLKSLRKPASLKQIRKATQIFRKNHPHIIIAHSFILGFPGETYRELFATFNFAKELNIDWSTHSILQPLKDTRIFNELKVKEDSRTIETFGKGRSSAFTVGRDMVFKGLTFDDIFKDIVDFRTVEMNQVPTMYELQQFQIYFNVFVNLVGNVNLTSRGNPEILRRHSEDILKAYPMDPVLWGVNAKTAKMVGLNRQYDISMKKYNEALKNSTFWSAFFDVYDIGNHLGF